MKKHLTPTIREVVIKMVVNTFIVLLISYFLIWLWVALRVNVDTKVKSDTIVALGARIYLRQDVLNPCMVARVNQAINLYQEGYASKIIFSGGVDLEDGTVEAEAMKRMAVAKGVPESDVLTESKSSSTYENIKNSKQIMDQAGLKSAIIVTEPFHTPRAALVAKKQNINFTISPAYSSCWNNWTYLSRFLLREPAAMIGYLWQGKI